MDMKNYLKKWNLSKKLEIWNDYHNPLYIWWKCRKYFKFPQIKFYVGKPIWFFGFPLKNYINRFIDIRFKALGWKTKWGDFRHEWNPYISLILFNKLEFLITFGYWGKHTEMCRDIATWEAMLCYLYKNIPVDRLSKTHRWVGSNSLTTIEENVKWKYK